MKMSTMQQVIFKLDKEEYGLDIMKVITIEKYQEVVKTPNTPEYITGIINLRGSVLPVYSLRKKFHLQEKEPDDNTKIIVTVTNGMKIGFIVDSVEEILNVDDSNIEEAPKIVTGIDRRYINSIAKVDERMVILIDIDLIISEEEQLELGKVSEEHE
jgi:purine-binding chemotaxis protein CheW